MEMTSPALNAVEPVRMGILRASLRCGVLLLMGLGAGASGTAAQVARVDVEEEGRRLREAAGLEWRGQTDESEEVLMGLLRDYPTSSGGLFALERVLRSRSRVGQVLPFADAYLAADPRASGVRYMKLRVLVEVDSLDALDDVARAWFQAESGSPDPYREVSRLYARAFGDEEALTVLEEGRTALARQGAEGALAMELGDLRAKLGDSGGAVEEWARAVRRPQADVGLILRRIDRLEGDLETLVEPLLIALTQEPSTAEMRQTAIRVAVQMGLEARAQALALEALPGMNNAAAVEMLSDVAQRADEAALGSLRLWALQQQRSRMGERDARALDVRIVSAAMSAGDTAVALQAQTRLARALPAASVERRRVIADLIRVEAGTASSATLQTRLAGFSSEFPDAPELDELASLVAAGMATRGDRDMAFAALEGRIGPQASLERAYLYFAGDSVAAGRTALESALPSLAPSRATAGIQLLALLNRVSPASALALTQAAALDHHGHTIEAANMLAQAAATGPEEDVAPLLSQAARMARGAGLWEESGMWLSEVITSHPDAPEHPEAILDLARQRARAPEGLVEARALLQQLILERPNSPVVPAARRELQRIGRGT